LLNVINISKHPTQTTAATQEAEAILNKGKQLLVAAGIDESKIDLRIHHGVPADAILAVSVEIDANIIMIGRRGLSMVSELLMGSVSSAVLHRCGNSTIAIVAGSTKD
jgi:nucleotide-binding universal stress UspA family protein